MSAPDLTPAEAARLLGEYIAWRRDDSPTPVPYDAKRIGEALDLALVAVTAMAAAPRWTLDRPTAAGWYWYEDDAYGPAPVQLGLVNFGTAPADLLVEACQGESQELADIPVYELTGAWLPIAAPPPLSLEDPW